MTISTEKTVDNQTLLRDPLSDLARKQRKLLMLTSGLGATVGLTGLVPTKISTLGIEFAQTDQRLILVCLCFLIAYFLIAFFIYGHADFLVYHTRINYAEKQRVLEDIAGRSNAEAYEDLEIEGFRPELLDQEIYLRRKSLKTSKAREFFEFKMPLIFGLLVIMGLIFLAIF